MKRLERMCWRSGLNRCVGEAVRKDVLAKRCPRYAPDTLLTALQVAPAMASMVANGGPDTFRAALVKHSQRAPDTFTITPLIRF